LACPYALLSIGGRVMAIQRLAKPEEAGALDEDGIVAIEIELPQRSQQGFDSIAGGSGRQYWRVDVAHFLLKTCVPRPLRSAWAHSSLAASGSS
jgi:hypothetical protein